MVADAKVPACAARARSNSTPPCFLRPPREAAPHGDAPGDGVSFSKRTSLDDAARLLRRGENADVAEVERDQRKACFQRDLRRAQRLHGSCGRTHRSRSRSMPQGAGSTSRRDRSARSSLPPASRKRAPPGPAPFLRLRADDDLVQLPAREAAAERRIEQKEGRWESPAARGATAPARAGPARRSSSSRACRSFGRRRAGSVTTRSI